MSLLESLSYITGLFDKMTTEQLEIHKKNECNNLMIMCKLIMDRFLSKYANKCDEVLIEPQELKDLLIILEKMLIHGFKSKLPIYEGASFEDILEFIKHISETDPELKETYIQTIRLENLTENVTRIRAYLSLLIMMNKIDLFFKTIENQDISIYYEPLSFLRCQHMLIISDILLVLRGFTINFYLDQKELSLSPLNVDITNYIKPIKIIDSGSTELLEAENEKLRKELEAANEKLCSTKDIVIPCNNVNISDIDILNNVLKQIKIIPKEMDKLEESCSRNIRRVFNEIKMAEAKVMSLKSLLPEVLTNISNQNKKLNHLVEKKQKEIDGLKQEREDYKAKIEEMEAKHMENQVLAQELAELKLHQQQTISKLEEAETALKDLGPALSSSKLQIVNMKEQILPASEWVNDTEVTNCLSCNVDFSVMVRKHHCRRCGNIFCDNCSRHRVNLPSHAKAVRVCSNCLLLMESMNSSPNVN